MNDCFFRLIKLEILLALFLTSFSTYADQPVPRFPKDDFKYSCHSELSEQVAGEYVTAFMDFSFDRTAMLDRLYFEKSFSESDWTLSDYFQKKGKSLPKNSSGYMSFSFGYESNAKAEDSIFVFGNINSAKIAFASSKVSASFSRKEQLVLNLQVTTRADKTTVTLNTTCDRLE